MYNNDSNSLNAGAPDIRLSGNQQDSGIMAAAPGTYSQRRKQMMAYGGIAGADGRKRYGLGSLFQEYIKDPLERTFRGVDQSVLDSESQMRVDEQDQVIRMDPRTGRQFDLSNYNPATDPPLTDENFPPISSGPAYTPAYEKIFDPIRDAYGGITNALTQGNLTQFLPFTQRMTDEGQQGILPFGIQDFLNLRNLESLQPYLKKEIRPAVAAQAATKTFKGQETGQPPVYETTPAIPEQAALYEQRVNPLYPIAAGLGVGKYVSGLPKDKLPIDTTSIDPAAIAAAATGTDAEGAAAGLRFLPPQVARAAEGGRIGYALGKGVESLPVDQMKGIEGQQAGMSTSMMEIISVLETLPIDQQLRAIQMLPENMRQQVEEALGLDGKFAQGGRIGYAEAGDVLPEAPMSKEEMEERNLGSMYDEENPMTRSELRKFMERQRQKRLLILLKNRRGAQEGGLMNLGGRIGLKGGKNPRDVLWSGVLDPEWDIDADDLRSIIKHLQAAKDGGRIGAQEGGLMNLGGMEKDYRNEGGFVALGGEEKADDVPARLSKNEFVFTADAVRGAGEGDIDKGAEIMENMMKHLEAGGEVSEDSQGLEGARGMFANAQKLQNRII